MKKKVVFNSLGSNYNKAFRQKARKLLFNVNPSSNKLRKLLNTIYNGQSFLFLKGRDAIEFTLKSFNIKPGQGIITQAFTCYAIEQAIKRAKLTPIYADIGSHSLNLNVGTIQEAYQKHPNSKAVIVQHSLGTVANIRQIKKFCQNHNLLLIEDLAQGFGGTDNKDHPLGTLADGIILSFGRDKVWDAITGGAAIIKKPNNQTHSIYSQVINFYDLSNWRLSLSQILLYPTITRIITKNYPNYMSKIIHTLAKKTNLIESPLKNNYQKMVKIPEQIAELALFQFKTIEESLKQRKKKSLIYYNLFKKINKIKLLTTNFDIEHGSNLRFNILVNSIKTKNNLISYLQKNHYYLSDYWYKNTVDCSTLKCNSVYVDLSCPNAEQKSNFIFNLPTHQAITVDEVQQLSQLIKQFYNYSPID